MSFGSRSPPRCSAARARLAWLLAGSTTLACAPAASAPPPRPTPLALASASSGEADPPQPAPAGPAAPELPRSGAVLTRIFERPVYFCTSGEGGRLAVLTVEDGALVPHRYEAGLWERLPLPEAHRVAAGDPVGIHFGRDNRPRLMGHRATGKKMVYLRYRDGRWQDQRTELGALAGDDARLFGVLGEADPEVVCRVDKLCLFKTRKGWQEAKPTIPAEAVVRAFAGRGYALTSGGLFRTGPSGFEALGPSAPWSTATGFWSSPEGGAVVAEPAKDLLHELDPTTSAWRSRASPIRGPRDVVGPADRRVVVGDGGAARSEKGGFVRLGEPTLRLSRAMEAQGRLILTGESGVHTVAAE